MLGVQIMEHVIAALDRDLRSSCALLAPSVSRIQSLDKNKTCFLFYEKTPSTLKLSSVFVLKKAFETRY